MQGERMAMRRARRSSRAAASLPYLLKHDAAVASSATDTPSRALQTGHHRPGVRGRHRSRHPGHHLRNLIIRASGASLRPSFPTAARMAHPQITGRRRLCSCRTRATRAPRRTLAANLAVQKAPWWRTWRHSRGDGDISIRAQRKIAALWRTRCRSGCPGGEEGNAEAKAAGVQASCDERLGAGAAAAGGRHAAAMQCDHLRC